MPIRETTPAESGKVGPSRKERAVSAAAAVLRVLQDAAARDEWLTRRQLIARAGIPAGLFVGAVVRLRELGHTLSCVGRKWQLGGIEGPLREEGFGPRKGSPARSEVWEDFATRSRRRKGARAVGDRKAIDEERRRVYREFCRDPESMLRIRRIPGAKPKEANVGRRVEDGVVV